MTQPTPYDRQTSFTQHSANFPSRPQSGASLDSEFNAVKISLDETQANLALIQDDDGALARGSVGRAQLDSSITIGFDAPAAWRPDTVYDADSSTVFFQSIFYICIETHTSTAVFEPAKWEEIADLTAAAAIPDGSITSAKLADDAVIAAKISPLAVTNTKLASNAVSTSKVQDSAVTTDKIADVNVTTAKLAATAVTTDKIADSNVTTAKIANGGVTVDKLADNSVIASKILNGEVTKAKLNSNIRASQAEMEAGIALDVFPSPALVKYSPGVAKAWGLVANGGSATLVFGYNVNNVVRVSTGVVRINFTVGFSSTSFVVVAFPVAEGAVVGTNAVGQAASASAAQVTTTLDQSTSSTTQVVTDRSFYFVVFGDQ